MLYDLIMEGSEDQIKLFEARNRSEEIYSPIFEADHDIDWVMVGLDSGTVYFQGVDDELPTVSDFAKLQEDMGEHIEIFGRPVDIGLDGTDPFAE